MPEIKTNCVPAGPEKTAAYERACQELADWLVERGVMTSMDDGALGSIWSQACVTIAGEILQRVDPGNRQMAIRHLQTQMENVAWKMAGAPS